MRGAPRVAGDERAGTGRRHMRELLVAERGRHLGKLRAEHAAETAALRHVGQFAHFAAARARQERRRAAVAVEPAQVARVVTCERGAGAAHERTRVDPEPRLEELDEFVGLRSERLGRGAVGGTRVKEPRVLLSHDRRARTRWRHDRVKRPEHRAHPPRERGRVGGQPVRQHRLPAASLRERNLGRDAATLENEHRRLQRARRKRFGKAGGEERDAHRWHCTSRPNGCADEFVWSELFRTTVSRSEPRTCHPRNRCLFLRRRRQRHRRTSCRRLPEAP